MTPEERLKQIRGAVETERPASEDPGLTLVLMLQRTWLLSELDRVTAEREEWRHKALAASEHPAVHACIRERDAALAELREARREADALEDVNMNIAAQRDAALAELARRDVSSAMSPDVLAAQRDAALAQVEKLEAFKAYVHKRLDDAGIPADPPSPHRESGCRIGGRLDIALAATEPKR